MERYKSAALALIIISFVSSALLYSHMPEQMAFHWNAWGKADSYAPKVMGLFMLPAVAVLMLMLFIFLPKIDPLKENIIKFGKYYNGFILVMISFLLYMQLLVMLWNSGIVFSMMQAIIPAFGVLFYYIGIMLEKAKRNWFIGIRTPWTLSSEKVWNKTHKLGGMLFKLSGAAALLGLAVPGYAIFFVIGPVILAAACSIVYSYKVYSRTAS